MRIGVVAPRPEPFRPGGAERLVEGLAAALSRAGHEVGIETVPVSEATFGSILEGYRAFSRLDLSAYDRVVTGKYPAWMVAHPDHVVYMLHPLRGVYDAYHLFELPVDPPPSPGVIRRLVEMLRRPPDGSLVDEVYHRAGDVVAELGDDHPDLSVPSPLLRRLVHWLDAAALDPRRVRRHLAISATVAARPGYFPPGVEAQVVYPPSTLGDAPTVGPDGGPSGRHRSTILAPGRLDRPKRFDLVIEALRHTRTPVRVDIVGSGPDERRLRDLAAGDPRIRFLGRIPDRELASRYAACLAVAFVPHDEDLGYVTFEAFAAGRPVVTCADSGGPTEFVVDGSTGLVVEPDPGALAAAFDRLADDQAAADRMGAAGRERIGSVTWEPVVDAIAGPPVREVPGPRHAGPRPRAGMGRPGVVVVSTYPVDPPRGGGQLRCRHLFDPLAVDHDVTYVCLAFPGQGSSRRDLGPGLRQVVVEPSPGFRALESEVEAAVGIPVSDLVATMRAADESALVAETAEVASGAVLAILAQPYLLPLVRRAAPDLAVVHDSQNHETAMKRALLPAGAVADRLVSLVAEVEQRACGSPLTTVCSPDELASLAAWCPPDRPPVLVPNGTDVAGVPFVEPDERRRRGRAWLDTWRRTGGGPAERLALFVGSWHPPNLDAVELLLDTARLTPTTIFVVVGSVCGYFAGRDLPPNVVLRGAVGRGELAALLGTAHVGLNPMRQGAGTNLKVLEYFAAGLPVVATAVGVRGIGARPGVTHLEIPVDDPTVAARALAGAVDACWGDGVGDRVASARRLVARTYDWPLLAARFRRALADRGLVGPVGAVGRGRGGSVAGVV